MYWYLGHPSRGFDGYVDKKATEKKIVRDVLRKGDMYFRYLNLTYWFKIQISMYRYLTLFI
jgi:hypothetical protein